MRNAARVQIYEEFSQRVGDIVTGTVPDHARLHVVKIREGVEAETAPLRPASLPRRAQRAPAGPGATPTTSASRPSSSRSATPTTPSRRPQRHQRPPIVVSRTHRTCSVASLRGRGARVYDGIVEIRSVAREAGVRSRWPSPPTTTTSIRWAPASAPGQPRPPSSPSCAASLVDVVLWRPRQSAWPAPSPRRASLACSSMRQELRHGHRSRRPAFPGHRQGGPERPPRRPPHRHAHRHQNESLAAGVLRDLPLTVAESDDGTREAHRCEYVGGNGVSAATWRVRAPASAACTSAWTASRSPTTPTPSSKGNARPKICPRARARCFGR